MCRYTLGLLISVHAMSIYLSRLMCVCWQPVQDNGNNNFQWRQVRYVCVCVLKEALCGTIQSKQYIRESNYRYFRVRLAHTLTILLSQSLYGMGNRKVMRSSSSFRRLRTTHTHVRVCTGLVEASGNPRDSRGGSLLLWCACVTLH